MKNPNQIERKIQKYFKLDLTDKETKNALEELQLALVIKKILIERCINYAIKIAKDKDLEKKVNGMFDEKKVARNLSKDFFEIMKKDEQLNTIAEKARKGEDLTIIEYNWLQKELKKAD